MLCHICKENNPIMNIVGGGQCDGNKINVTLENGNNMDLHSYNIGVKKHCCTTCKYSNKKRNIKCLNCRDLDLEASDYNFEASKIR